MKKLYLHLDGTFKDIQEIPSSWSPQEIIDNVILVSHEGEDFHVIAGSNLDSETNTDKAANVVASAGVLIFQNLVNPPH